MRHHELSVDLCVAGGGMAGVCAALAAARNGARVVLIQDRSVLGGNASSEVRMHIAGADFHSNRPGARESGLIEELRLEDAARNPNRSFSMWDLLLYEKIRQEPNITLLLDTDCIGCDTEEIDGAVRIAVLHAVRQSTEDTYAVRARFFADCTGDGRLGLDAGADFRMGREGRAEFGESLAVAEADTQTLGSSILFTARKYPEPQPFLAPAWVRRFGKEEFRHRGIDSYEYGYWWAEWGGQLDTVKDNGQIRDELLRIALGIWDYVKNSGDHPESARWALDWVGALPGKRESRRFLGPHILTQNDVEAGRIFDDQVAYGGWWIDLHPPTGVDAVGEAPCRHYPVPHLYSIPLRALYSRNIGNLFFAGRNISATHIAFASTRVMATCSLMGQAVGTAAAVGAAAGVSRAADLLLPPLLPRLQQTLLKDDAFLLNLTNDDPADLARAAEVRASAAAPGTAARGMVGGFTRDLRAEWAPWAGETVSGWRSATLPAWVELAFSRETSFSELHLTFDSGFHRELILSPSDYVTSKVIRGPQPELVRAFRILLDGRVVHEEERNFLRKRVLRFPGGLAGLLLRVELLATHGAPTARVFEIRAYA